MIFLLSDASKSSPGVSAPGCGILVSDKQKPSSPNRFRLGRKCSGIASILVLIFGLSACNSLVPSQVPDTYDLTALEKFPDLRGRTSAQLLILEPSALKVLDSELIVIRPSSAEVQYVGKSQWSDRLPKLVQAKLVETFENTGRARAVAKPGEGLVIDYQLVSDIRSFEASIADRNVAKVAISIKLVSDRTGKVVRTRVFKATAPLSGTDGLSVATALDVAFDKVCADIVNWTYSGI